ncbi:MAG: methyltransferase domain-containing protein [candidate division WOR-3 bacterium]|nr:methyltransferase domain-containing protein [candidate division WOR-3 bacterium]
MRHIEHYIYDNEITDYDSIPLPEKGKILYRYSIIASLIACKGTILEIGSGNGLLCSFTDRIIHSLDISQVNNRAHALKTEGDIYDMPYRDNTFDTIILSQVLEHLEHPVAALTEIKRILTPEGSVIITVPYNEQIKYTLCIHCNKPTPLNAHLHSFNRKKLYTLAHSVNMHVAKTIVFENKLLTKLLLFSTYRVFPFFLMRLFDSVAKIVFNRYNKILIVLKMGQ